MVLAGTEEGALWVVSDVFTRMPFKQEFGLHLGACTALSMTSDARYVVSAGEDGAIFFIDLAGERANSALPTGSQEDTADGDVVMINRGEMQIREEELEQLVSDNAALETKVAEEATRLQAVCRARVMEARAQDQDAIQRLRAEYEHVQRSSTSKEREVLRDLKGMEAAHVQ